LFLVLQQQSYNENGSICGEPSFFINGVSSIGVIFGLSLGVLSLGVLSLGVMGPNIGLESGVIIFL
jgi:hypothetical protein